MGAGVGNNDFRNTGAPADGVGLRAATVKFPCFEGDAMNLLFDIPV